jgi:hypothetical protein
MPFGMSGNSMTPNWDPAMSKLLSSTSSAWAIDDTCLDFEPLLVRSRTEQFEHDGRLVRRHYLGAQARRRDTQRIAARCHVQKPHASPQLGTAEAFGPKPHLRGSIGLIVA